MHYRFALCTRAAGGRMAEVTVKMTDIQEALRELVAVRSAMADPLRRWSAEPHRTEIVREVVAAFSDLQSRETAYQSLLQQAVLELLEQVASLQERAG
jgi:hypothetical protein